MSVNALRTRLRSQDAVMAPSVEGYTYQFHRQVDYRDLNRK